MKETNAAKPLSADGSMFKRAGAWFGIFQQGSVYGDVSLYLGTCHGLSQKAPSKDRMADIFPTFAGHKVPFTVALQPAELRLDTRHGSVRFTFADETKLLATGDAGMGLLFQKDMTAHETVRPRRNGAWEAAFRLSASFIFQGLEGSGFAFHGGKDCWDWEALSSGPVEGRTIPGPNGGFTLVLEEFPYCGIVRDAYPTYAQARAAMQSAWDGFIARVPAYPAHLDASRTDCLYTLWSYLTGPWGTAKYTMIRMFAGTMGSQWQMCQNAVALLEQKELSMELLLGPLDRASAEGQLPDSYDDAGCETQIIKPPVHGWAVKQLMRSRDLLADHPREKLEMLYTGMGAWGDWFMNCRDEDGDGLPTLIHGDETGLDDATLFKRHLSVTSPDLAAYLVLLFESVGDLAELLGKPEGETAAWYARSEALLARMLARLWDGAHFVGLAPETGETLFSGSILHYIPAILGKRLPAEVLDKLVADLSDPNVFLSPWGLAGEDMSGDDYSASGGSIGRGSVIPPVMLLIVTGLWDSHQRPFARDLAERYCAALRDKGFPFLIDPVTGAGSGYFGGSWPRCAYAILARLLGE